MRVLMSSVGTRGDVQPVLALALEVRALGAEVRLCIPPNFLDWAAALGLEARSLGIEMRAPRAGATVQAPAVIPDLITDQFDTLLSAAQGCDLIVGGGAHQYAARSIAELHEVDCVVAVYAPTSLGEDGKPAWNARSLERVNLNRTRLGLAPVADVLGHILGDRPWLAADATLGPAPLTPGMQVVQTGAWMLQDQGALAPELEAFLMSGEPPIYIGFGCMPVADGTSRVVIDAARATGRRVILSRGWADLAAIDDIADCIVIDDVNQAALFPRVAAIVHHGGAGTTTTAARAGVPQVAVPMFSDQFYWGQRLRDLRIGAAVPFAGLSVEVLASALHEVLERDTASNARAVALKVNTDGAAIAARELVDAP